MMSSLRINHLCSFHQFCWHQFQTLSLWLNHFWSILCISKSIAINLIELIIRFLLNTCSSFNLLLLFESIYQQLTSTQFQSHLCFNYHLQILEHQSLYSFLMKRSLIAFSLIFQLHSCTSHVISSLSSHLDLALLQYRSSQSLRARSHLCLMTRLFYSLSWWVIVSSSRIIVLHSIIIQHHHQLKMLQSSAIIQHSSYWVSSSLIRSMTSSLDSSSSIAFKLQALHRWSWMINVS